MWATVKSIFIAVALFVIVGASIGAVYFLSIFGGALALLTLAFIVIREVIREPEGE